MAKILCIENDLRHQQIIGQALFREEHQIHYARNGQEGYEKVQTLDPDLILLDLLIPIINGVELLRKLKNNKNTQPIPVVIVTACADEEGMLELCLKALGAETYFRKPVSAQGFLPRVKKILARYPRFMRSRAGTQNTPLRKGVIRADPKFRTVRIGDRLVCTLPHKRFALLKRLMEADGPVLRKTLLQDMDYAADQNNTLEKTVQRLREDFGAAQNRRIQTHPHGYELIG